MKPALLIFNLAIIFASASLFSACGGEESKAVPDPSSKCATGSAQIGVYDNDSQVICGCSETASRVTSNTNLQCTVSQNTVVFFHFFGIQNQHELAHTSTTPLFPDSPHIDPRADQPIREHTVKFTTKGTFNYQDLHNSAIYGQIIVN